mgnify:FL=1|jgi:hypothetical protein
MKLFYATFAGVIAAFISMMFLEGLGHSLFPLPFKVDPNNIGAIADKLHLIPVQMYISVVVAHGLGLLIGLLIAKAIDKTSKISLYIIGGFFLVGTIANLSMIPHPMWFAIADITIIALVGLLMIRKPVAPN